MTFSPHHWIFGGPIFRGLIFLSFRGRFAEYPTISPLYDLPFPKMGEFTLQR